MSKTALTHLQEQIDAIRREAFAEGYAAAMQAVSDFAARPAPPGTPDRAPSATRPADLRRRTTRRATRRSRSTTTQRAAPAKLARGANARMVEEALQSIAPRAARPAEIRNLIRNDKGVAIGFTSLRHALGQLEARQAIEQVADTKTWRHLSSTSAPA